MYSHGLAIHWWIFTTLNCSITGCAALSYFLQDFRQNFNIILSRFEKKQLSMEIPVVDFNVYELGKTNVAVHNLEKLSNGLRRAFTEVGFVYLKNTGINQDEVCYF